MAGRSINLLFVCTANVCRSPLAAGLMAFNAKHLDAPVNVASASLDQEIRDTHPTTVRMLAAKGVALDRLRSQPLNEHLITGADLILVMTADHAKAVVGRFPRHRAKVFLLEHLANEVHPAEPDETVGSWVASMHRVRRNYARDDQWDIQDPNGESDAVYQAVEVQIDNATVWLSTVISTLP